MANVYHLKVLCKIFMYNFRLLLLKIPLSQKARLANASLASFFFNPTVGVFAFTLGTQILRLFRRRSFTHQSLGDHNLGPFSIRPC